MEHYLGSPKIPEMHLAFFWFNKGCESMGATEDSYPIKERKKYFNKLWDEKLKKLWEKWNHCLTCGKELVDNESVHCRECNEKLVDEVNFQQDWRWFE